MKIQKFVKDNGNKYKVYVDDEVYKLYDDIIVKYGLTISGVFSIDVGLIPSWASCIPA